MFVHNEAKISKDICIKATNNRLHNFPLRVFNFLSLPVKATAIMIFYVYKNFVADIYIRIKVTACVKKYNSTEI